MTTVKELIGLYIEEDNLIVEVYCLEEDKTVFKGKSCEIDDDLLYENITSIDNPQKKDYLVINI